MDDDLNSRLKPLRERIDVLDAQLIALLNQRASVALEVGFVRSARCRSSRDCRK
jgi:chorismate mutase/prephenate dehydratase